jgi:hypothetical protein
MAVIYLRHASHGAKVATSDMEADRDRENGWEDYDPNNLTVDAAPDELEPVNELQPRRRSRRTQEAEL